MQRYLYYSSENPPNPNTENAQNENLDINNHPAPPNSVNPNQNERNIFTGNNEVVIYKDDANPETEKPLNN